MKRIVIALSLVLFAAGAYAQDRKGAYPTQDDTPREPSAAGTMAIKVGTVMMVFGLAVYLLKRGRERDKKEFLVDINRAIPQAGKPRPTGLDVLAPQGLKRPPKPLASDAAVSVFRDEKPEGSSEPSIWKDGGKPGSEGQIRGAEQVKLPQFKKIEPRAAKINQAGLKADDLRR